MSRDTEALKPAWLRMSQPELLDVRPLDSWPVVSSLSCECHEGRDWIRWAADREMRWNAMDSGRHRSGLQVEGANLTGALGEAAYHLVTRTPARGWRDDRRGIGGADFVDGADVKSTRHYYNPFLIVPRGQRAAPRYALVAVEKRQIVDGGPRALVCWAVAREKMVELAEVNATFDPRRFVDWYGNGVKHYAVNWAQVPLDEGLVSSAGSEPPAEPPQPADGDKAREAVRQMRLMLGPKEGL